MRPPGGAAARPGAHVRAARAACTATAGGIGGKTRPTHAAASQDRCDDKVRVCLLASLWLSSHADLFALNPRRGHDVGRPATISHALNAALATVCVAVGQWRGRRSSSPSSQWVHISIAFTLRPSLRETLSACSRLRLQHGMLQFHLQSTHLVGRRRESQVRVLWCVWAVQC